MRPKALVAIAAVMVVSMAGLGVAASTAQAAETAPAAPTTPYPNVPTNSEVCKPEWDAVNAKRSFYGAAVTAYNQAVAVPLEHNEVRRLNVKRINAGIALNAARYELAKCQNDKANPADKACIELALELNLHIDKLAWQKELVALLEGALYTKRRLKDRPKAEILELEGELTVATGEQKKSEDAIALNLALIVLKQCKDAVRPRPRPTGQQTTLPASDGPVHVTTGPAPADPLPTGSAPNAPSTTVG